MAVERTLSIIKPDATAKPGAAGEILARFEKAGLAIVALKRIQLSEQLARGFYAVHKARPFYGDLVKFMTSGPVVVSVLEGANAVQKHRDLLGPTALRRRLLSRSAHAPRHDEAAEPALLRVDSRVDRYVSEDLRRDRAEESGFPSSPGWTR